MRAVPAGRRRIVLGALAVCAAVLTSACAAGKHAQTAEESPAIDGVGASVGSMLLREVAVAAPPNATSYAKGDAAVLRVVVVNNGQADDQLTSISTPAASGVSLYDSLDAAAAVLPGTGSPSAGGSSSAVGTSPSTPPSATSSSSASSAAAFSPVTVPALGRDAFGVSGTDRVLVLTGLTATLYPAALVPVTFTFANAGSVTVQVPVQLTASDSPTGVVVSDTVSSSPGI